MTANPKAQTEAQIEDQNALDSTNSNASFGPWMVVSHKRNNNKRVKQKNTSSLTGTRKDLYHGKPKELLESPSCNKYWARPSDTNDSSGKRKA